METYISNSLIIAFLSDSASMAYALCYQLVDPEEIDVTRSTGVSLNNTRQMTAGLSAGFTIAPRTNFEILWDKGNNPV